jgi:hypothetical protein
LNSFSLIVSRSTASTVRTPLSASSSLSIQRTERHVAHPLTGRLMCPSLLSYSWGDRTCAFLTRQTQAWSHPVRHPGECSRLPVCTGRNPVWATWCGPCRMVSHATSDRSPATSPADQASQGRHQQNPRVSRRREGAGGADPPRRSDQGETLVGKAGAAPAHVLRSWVEQAMAAGEPLQEGEHGGPPRQPRKRRTELHVPGANHELLHRSRHLRPAGPPRRVKKAACREPTRRRR